MILSLEEARKIYKNVYQGFIGTGSSDLHHLNGKSIFVILTREAWQMYDSLTKRLRTLGRVLYSNLVEDKRTFYFNRPFTVDGRIIYCVTCNCNHSYMLTNFEKTGLKV